MGHMIIHLKDTDDASVYIQRAAEIIQEGGIIAYPTDTVYGIGADPLNPNAIHRVFEIKQRDAENGLPVLVPDLEDAMKIGVFQSIEKKLAAEFWPGALTIVVPLRKDTSALPIDKIITGGKDTIAIRIPSNPIIHGICEEVKKLTGFGGIIGTSANFSGEPSSTSGKRVSEDFSNILDFIIETGDCENNLPSTVIRIDHSQSSREGKLQIFRDGKVPKAQILSVIMENQ